MGLKEEIIEALKVQPCTIPELQIKLGFKQYSTVRSAMLSLFDSDLVRIGGHKDSSYLYRLTDKAKQVSEYDHLEKIPIGQLSGVLGELTQPVAITRNRKVIGVYTPC